MKEVKNESGLTPPHPNEAELQARYDELEARFRELTADDDMTAEEFDQRLDNGTPVEVESSLTAEQAREIDSITLMRIYDMLGAILTHLDEDAAEALLNEHAAGRLVGPFPFIDMQAPPEPQE